MLDGFLVKPVSDRRLVDSIDAIFAPVTFTSPSPSGKQEPALHQTEAGLQGRRVLLVEDNEINSDLASELLSDLGIMVTVAAHGREAVERVSNEAFDLVLMDIQIADHGWFDRHRTYPPGPPLQQSAHHRHDRPCYERRSRGAACGQA